MTVNYTTLHRFYNENDIPAFGCGKRSVIALPPGRKYVILIDWTTLDTAKVTLELWKRLKPESFEARTKAVIMAMRERMPYKFPPTEDGKPGKPTQTIKYTLQYLKGKTDE